MGSMSALPHSFDALIHPGPDLLAIAALQDGAVEVDGWLLAGGAAAIVIVFTIYQAIQRAKAARVKEEVIFKLPL